MKLSAFTVILNGRPFTFDMESDKDVAPGDIKGVVVESDNGPDYCMIGHCTNLSDCAWLAGNVLDDVGLPKHGKLADDLAGMIYVLADR